MEVAFATVADSANVSREGKLNILGVFDSIYAPAFPTRHPHMCFAFTLRMEYDDQQQEKSIDISLIDADGRKLWGATGQITIGEAQPGQFSHVHQIVNLVAVAFEHEGRYRFRIKIPDRDEPYDTVFQVVKRQEGAGAP